MQLYTHPVVGAFVGILLFPKSPLAQAACVVGATLPDVPIVFQVLADKWKGRPSFSNQPLAGMWFTSKEISHTVSLLPILLGILWAGDLWIGGPFWRNEGLALFVGIFIHIAIDIPTHGCPKHKTYKERLLDPNEKGDNQSFAWPFYQLGWVPDLGSIFGLVDYRSNPPSLLKLKPFEVVFLISTWAGWLVALKTHNRAMAIVSAVTIVVVAGMMYGVGVLSRCLTSTDDE
jgi:hypothetical protein